MDEMQAIAGELTIIRWLLVGLVVLFILFLAGLTAFVRSFGRLVEQNQAAMESGEPEMENLLAEDRLGEARKRGLQWVKEQPGNPLARWLLARAHYRLNELVDAKAHLEKIVELAPDWDDYVQPWLERVNEEIREHRPRSVD